MKEVFTVLIVGGARSGKSSLACRLAERLFDTPAYLATAEVTDDEMRERIEMHRKERGDKWLCIEEPLDLAKAIRSAGKADGILLDCVTVWLGNVLYHEDIDRLSERKAALLAQLEARKKSIIIVTNELGQGIVPADAETRAFRDQAGWLNQDLASAADAVVLVSCGLPIVLKGQDVIEKIGGLL